MAQNGNTKFAVKIFSKNLLTPSPSPRKVVVDMTKQSNQSKRLRRVVQFRYIDESPSYHAKLLVLCDDGTLWITRFTHSKIDQWNDGWATLDLSNIETTELP